MILKLTDIIPYFLLEKEPLGIGNRTKQVKAYMILRRENLQLQIFLHQP